MFVLTKNCCLCCLVLVYFCFLRCFLLVSVFVRAISLCKKKKKKIHWPSKSTKHYKRTEGYGGPTKPLLVLDTYKHEISLSGLFKKINFLDDLIYITTK